jgi:L-alanine-DL-glutamate epimerase-like enolase superfamily enzyme
MLQAVCAAGALTALEALQAEWGFAQDNPGTAVADRASAIRITMLEPMQVATRVFLRITTNQQVTGWGEVAGLPRQETLALIWRAALEGAPPDAIYRDVAGWKTITDIRDPAMLGALGLAPLRRSPAR